MYNETFASLDRWSHAYFRGISRHSDYSITSRNGQSVLRASANASASYLRFDTVYNIRDFPVLRWRWLVETVYTKGDGTRKSGDDFPLRVYIIFEYTAAEASWQERLQFTAARLIHGEYPPHSALSYVWESRGPVGRIIINPYTDRARQIVLQSGPAAIDDWRDEAVNVLEDYRRAFGADPPGRATLAIMSDADNTGEAAVSYIAYLEIAAE